MRAHNQSSYIAPKKVCVFFLKGYPRFKFRHPCAELRRTVRSCSVILPLTETMCVLMQSRKNDSPRERMGWEPRLLLSVKCWRERRVWHEYCFRAYQIDLSCAIISLYTPCFACCAMLRVLKPAVTLMFLQDNEMRLM